jgi:predicted metalloprotease with PDZ domain
MQYLYKEFALKGRGVSDEDYKETVEKIAKADYSGIFDNLIFGTADYLPYLQNAAEILGLTIKKENTGKAHESYLGVILNENKITDCMPGSLAEQVGLSVGDELISINQIIPQNDWEQWFNYFIDDEISLQVKKYTGELREINFKLDKSTIFINKYTIEENPTKTDKQKANFDFWSGNC